MFTYYITENKKKYLNIRMSLYIKLYNQNNTYCFNRYTSVKNFI